MRSAFLREVLAATFILMATILPASARAQASDLVDLGVAIGYAINNAGQVVLSTGIYSNGTTTPLPALPGQTTPATGAAINAAGQVAGSAPTSMPNPAGGNFDFTVPVEYSSGTLTILQSPIEYADNISSEAYATGINSGAEIVGYSVSPDIGPSNIVQGYDDVGFIYANGTLNSLPSSGPLPVTDMPQGINDSGRITGIRSIQDPNNPNTNRLDAYIYDSATGTTDLGQGAGYAVNAAGQVTGDLDVISIDVYGDTIIGSYAFLYSNGTTSALGTLPGGNYSAGYAINSTGQVVGSANSRGNPNSHAFFYNGVMTDLNSLISSADPLKPYVTLTNAVGINDGLLILANGVDARTNLNHAYLYQAPFIQIAPAALDFAAAATGSTSKSQSVTVTNAGTTAIPLGIASVTGNFSLQNGGCGTSLAAGAHCTLVVTFTPTVAGALTGTLTIPSGEANYQVALSGVATIVATISASSSAATVGLPLKITWSASPGSACTADGSTSSFQGSIPINGGKILTETAAGTVSYLINCTAAGAPVVDPSTSVVWKWPAVTTAISASPTTITAGQSTTLTWESSNATSCTATGGGESDQWAGAKATSGSQTVTEAFGPSVSSAVLTFGIACNSATSGLSASASAKVTEGSSSAASSHGGGGALNPLSLVLLAGIFALRRIRHRTLDGPRAVP
jgi:probable HAF family extracellular repeat protein